MELWRAARFRFEMLHWIFAHAHWHTKTNRRSNVFWNYGWFIRTDTILPLGIWHLYSLLFMNIYDQKTISGISIQNLNIILSFFVRFYWHSSCVESKKNNARKTKTSFLLLLLSGMQPGANKTSARSTAISISSYVNHFKRWSHYGHK